MRTHFAAAAAIGIMAGTPASALARPADVLIVNPASQPAHVQITGTPTVKVDTQDGPVRVRPTATHFADSASLTASAGSSFCKSMEVQSGGRVRLTSVVASATGAATADAKPGVVLRLWSERDPETAAGNGIRIDLPVPLELMTPGATFTWGGSVSTAMMLGSGNLSALDGLGTDVSLCVHASSSSPTTAHVYLSGEYL